jgi:hypothetical protein
MGSKEKECNILKENLPYTDPSEDESLGVPIESDCLRKLIAI